jgi:hypothetical protein
MMETEALELGVSLGFKLLRLGGGSSIEKLRYFALISLRHYSYNGRSSEVNRRSGRLFKQKNGNEEDPGAILCNMLTKSVCFDVLAGFRIQRGIRLVR